MSENIPHSLGGFRGAFESEHGRKPTEQEIWNAAISSWRDLTRQKSDAVKEQVVEELLMYAGDKWPDPEMTAEEYAREALSAAKAVDHMPDAGKMVQPQAQGEANNFPFYELKFIMRVLGHKGDAPKADWDTAYGMAREIFTRWHTATINPQAQGEAVDYDYQATFNAIAEAAKPSANGLAISVKKFWESYRASTHPQASEPTT